MGSIRRLAGCGALLSACAAGVVTASDLNEVGAFLAYPVVSAGPGQETFVTVTNTGSDAINAHISVIEGVGTASSPECAEYDRIQKLTGYDTETFVLYPHANGIRLDSLDSEFSFAVPVQNGFITINVEEFDFHDSTPVKLTSNVLMGSEVVVDYGLGYAYSLDAIPFQGFTPAPNGQRSYRFDGSEYSLFPRRIAVDFLAPDGPGSGQFSTPVSAELVLFTLAFEHKFPPMSVCSISAFDARENLISGSLMFGCWAAIDLATQPELAWPELGDAGNPDNHGWLTLNCVVDTNRDDEVLVRGGVHGAIVQTARGGAAIHRPDGPVLPLSRPERDKSSQISTAEEGAVAWSRLMHQSTGTSDGFVFRLEEFSSFEDQDPD